MTIALKRIICAFFIVMTTLSAEGAAFGSPLIIGQPDGMKALSDQVIHQAQRRGGGFGGYRPPPTYRPPVYAPRPTYRAPTPIPIPTYRALQPTGQPNYNPGPRIQPTVKVQQQNQSRTIAVRPPSFARPIFNPNGRGSPISNSGRSVEQLGGPRSSYVTSRSSIQRLLHSGTYRGINGVTRQSIGSPKNAISRTAATAIVGRARKSGNALSRRPTLGARQTQSVIRGVAAATIVGASKLLRGPDDNKVSQPAIAVQSSQQLNYRRQLLAAIRSKNGENPRQKWIFLKSYSSNQNNWESRAGVIRKFVTVKEEVYYRVYSDPKSTKGSYIVKVPPKSGEFAINALNLGDGNKATYIQKVTVPAGVELERSRARGRGPWEFKKRGGAEQFFIAESERSKGIKFHEGVELRP